MENTSTILRIYACGGAGINVASLFDKADTKPVRRETDFASFDVSYIDTSKSNLNNKTLNAFVIPGLDGQGQLRGNDLELITSYIPTIMLEHVPADINIVLHSAGGGSGSIIGPLIVQELFNRGQQVIVVLIGSSSSMTEATNTRDSLLSYANCNRAMDKVIPIAWYENGKGKSQSQIDQEILFQISLLAVAYSGNNGRLDSADLKNWIDYPKTTGYPAELAALKVHVGEGPVHDAVSACTLLGIGQDLPALDVPYHTHGVVSPNVSASLHLEGDRKDPVSLVLIPGAFDLVVATLNNTINRSAERLKARRPSSLGSASGGLVIRK